MPNRIRLTILNGSFETGFPCILHYPQGNAIAQVQGHLPANSQVQRIYALWKQDYYSTVLADSRIKAVPTQVTYVSRKRSSDELVQTLNQWLNSNATDWQKIRDRLISVFSTDANAELIIESDQVEIRQLPLHTWNLLSESYPQVELALGSSSHQLPRQEQNNLIEPISILAVFGDGTGLDLTPDRIALEKLYSIANIEFLDSPSRDTLNHKLWSQSWQILFFAGHSVSNANGDTGSIGINESDSVEFSHLKQTLRHAVQQGMQLAIFNSCDGLGLAKVLEEVHIPAVIVMREPIPDPIAQKFLTHFLASFSTGQSLFVAIHEARQKLQIDEAQYPSASWLPVLCLNPAVFSLPRWQTQSFPNISTPLSSPPTKAARVLAISFIITAIILGCRSLGWLELTELWMYDQFVASRVLAEKPDPRILVVGITEEDLKKYGLQDLKMNRFVIGDRVLLDSLQRLQKLKPKTIGLDIIRDIKLDSSYDNLLKFLKSSTTTISPCASPDPETQSMGYLPPSGVTTEQQGFIAIPFDRDRVIRRYTLAADSPELGEGQCTTSQSLGLRLAARYLGLIDASESPQGEIQLNEAIIPILREPGVYQSPWSREKLQRGYQILTHYRSKNPAAGSQISLSDLLENRVNQKMVENRVVLMGYVTQSAGDDFETPITRNQERQLPGVLIHAQATSQILSFVLEKRPLMRSLSGIGDALWIGVCSLCGVIIAALKGRKRVGLFILFSIAVLGFPYALITLAWWIPAVPAVISFLGGFGGQAVYNLRHKNLHYPLLSHSRSPQSSQDP